MRRVTLQALVVCAVFSLGGGLAVAAATLAPVSSTEAAVTVKVTPRTLQGDTWEFDVAFDTHSQELADDLGKTAALVAADGSEVRPVEWKGAAPGGHHRAGVLRFKALDPRPAVVVLKIARANEPKPRVFRWKVE